MLNLKLCPWTRLFLVLSVKEKPHHPRVTKYNNLPLSLPSNRMRVIVVAPLVLLLHQAA